MKMHDIFGPGSNFEGRFVSDHAELVKRVVACRQLGLKIVLTSGTFDIHHVGHSRYLEKGKELAQGGILVVGVDNDEKVHKRKGNGRPVVAEQERMEVLCHLRHVDLVTLKSLNAPQWELIGLIKPDVLLITQETYDTPEGLKKLEDFCAEFGCKVVQLPPQATTSTTARIRLLMLSMKDEVKKKLEEVIQWIDEI